MRLTIVVGMTAGGVGAHVRSLVERLGALGVTTGVAGPAETEERFGFTAAGARFVPVEIGSAPNPPSDLAAVRALRRAFSGADAVHAHGFRAAALSGLALGRRRPGRTPLLATWHNAVLGGGPRRLVLGGVERLAARRADITLGVSSDLVRRARDLGAPRTRIAPVAAPVPRAPERSREDVRAELGAGDRPLLVAVNRLAEQKGLDTLLAAAARWGDRDPAPLTVVAGDGPEQDRLQHVIDRDGLAVRLLGRRGDVPDLLAAADLYVLSSVWEGRPLVVQEAMLAGLPVVATAAGGVPELVGDGAEVVPVGDDAAFARAVCGLLDDPARRDEQLQRAREQVAGWPDEDDNARLVADLCRELTSRRG
ncbi:glycosyltransferase involved in cell wall biosynthesis [Haloactinopolyspora alba]|uniref:Glycosyltransferase involved in cell wall biosynthesis n=1 Tax=Haloactinopolyspora alba TaxID=648780 RepID=A0A2P8E241_9ACTN|nr:glycosyltransferase family 4 protein [Haloactinopolyspora alba]PSL03535.1 glycosyltransferase involved in cell wall biosynthesis [Haloactinopolyspora alba]